ncbi:hypothetical protein FPHYL_2499 [Fusarium phyllophilum]|uniref:Uncharacterized protein n=1 Tax=Fusarium phyllophilum TaxID=47803 RepID=A0A8H5K7Q5_9HYPO|nr:hypothetical protein FPHYL_2499 [Fusarium phyllophilum]
MGDPFSIATGVAGLVSLGITVCDGLHTYFSAIKGRKDDLAIVTKNLALFKFHIFAVQSSASKIGHRHSPAIDGLQLSLINCEMQLKCIESLLNELMPAEDPSWAKEIWRRQKLTARYPFDRKKLVQLEEYLSRANTTLSSFIQALNLLEVISPEVEPSALQLLTSRVEDVAASSSNSIVLHQTAVDVAQSKTSFPGNERPFEDFAIAPSKPRYLQNAELERSLCKELSVIDCTCGASNSKTKNRPARSTYRFWGGLTVSRQGDVRSNHRPGCIFFQKSKRNISKTSLTYFGLLSLFSQSFTVSLMQEYPAGPYRVSFELQPCNVVESSPAFQLFRIRPGTINDMPGSDKNCLSPGQFAEKTINELKAIYQSGKASPFDVDQSGNNVAHICLRNFLNNFRFNKPLKSSDMAIDTIWKILSYLADIGVPITASNFKQCARPLMDMPWAPWGHLRPLDYALFHSKLLCSAPDQWTYCDECTCYLAVQLLLEADCNVTVSLTCPRVLVGCSLKARRLFFEHLKNRRERLRNLAIAVLPEETLRQYGVTSGCLPDKTAPLIYSRLQEIIKQQDHLSLGLSDSLEPYRGLKPQSFFAFPHTLKVAQLAIEYGLTPKDEIGVPTLLSGSSILNAFEEPGAIGYLDWLLQYDLKLDLSLDPFRLSALHRVSALIGDRIQRSLSLHLPLQDVSMSELQDARTLLAAICHSEALCNIPCPCSSGMFTRPLAHVLPAMLLYQGRSDSTYFLENMAENIEFVVRSIDLLKLSTCTSEQLYMAKCAIHILTMMSLGVRHLPICINNSNRYLDDSDDEEEWKEKLDEDRELIDQLETLDEEFGEAFDRQNVPIAEFLSGYWLTRMGQVIEGLNRPLTGDDRHDLLHIGVVLDEYETNGSECCVEHP